MRLSIDISDETHRDLKAKAAREGVTISDIVRSAIERYVSGNFHLGYPAPVINNAIAAPALPKPPEPPKPPTPYIRPISKAEQAKGKSRT
jgi:hypothetical protein